MKPNSKLGSLVSVLVAAGVACSHDRRNQSSVPMSRDDAGQELSDGGSANRADEADADAAGSLYTTDGPYRCCAADAGTSCCEGTKQGFCFQFGGDYGDCRGAGERYEGKVICAHCFPGRVRLADIVPGNGEPNDSLPEGCDSSRAPLSIGICLACGDGVCGTGENYCNCPADCPRP